MEDIYAKPGTKLKYIGATTEQVNWGGSDDPRGKLTEGGVYTLDHTEVHSWHTKVYLKEVEGRFNSVHFALALT